MRQNFKCLLLSYLKKVWVIKWEYHITEPLTMNQRLIGLNFKFGAF